MIRVFACVGVCHVRCVERAHACVLRVLCVVCVACMCTVWGLCVRVCALCVCVLCVRVCLCVPICSHGQALGNPSRSTAPFLPHMLSSALALALALAL